MVAAGLLMISRCRSGNSQRPRTRWSTPNHAGCIDLRRYTDGVVREFTSHPGYPELCTILDPLLRGGGSERS